MVNRSPANYTKNCSGTPMTLASTSSHRSFPRRRIPFRNKQGQSTIEPQRKRKATLSETVVSRSAILPKRNPVPHKHPARANDAIGNQDFTPRSRSAFGVSSCDFIARAFDFRNLPLRPRRRASEILIKLCRKRMLRINQRPSTSVWSAGAYRNHHFTNCNP